MVWKLITLRSLEPYIRLLMSVCYGAPMVTVVVANAEPVTATVGAGI